MKCCVPGCANLSNVMHYFPHPEKNSTKFRKWLEIIRNEKITLLPPMSVYKSYKICNKHFLKEHVSVNNRLYKQNPNIWPRLFLPGGNTEESSICAFAQLPGPSDAGNKSSSTGNMKSTSNKSTLKRINVSRIKNLTPREKKMYAEMLHLKKSLRKAQKGRLTYKTRLQFAERIASSVFFESQGKITPIVMQFFRSQLQNLPKKPRGRRFGFEDKVLALALNKKSGKGYNLLSKIFALPTRKTLMTLLNRVDLHPGLNNHMFKHLQKCVNHLSPKARYCVLMFDEIQIQPHLQWNRTTDIVGFERRAIIADHVQVSMLRGIVKNLKQSIYYTFCEGTTKKQHLIYALKEVIRATHQTVRCYQ